MSSTFVGEASPLGATVTRDGVNFSLFSRTATGVELVLFDHIDDGTPSRIVALDPVANRTYHYWHTFIPAVRPGQIYGYRVKGPSDFANGLRFDATKVLLDPYGRGVVVPKNYTPQAARLAADNAATAMKSVVVDSSLYNWEGDTPLRLPSARTIIYEMHVRGFTRHPNSGVKEAARGTYAGLIERIPYLQNLGITAVELLPVFAFDPLACPAGRVNYWGYQPVGYFAPHQAYSSSQDPLGPVNEFRDDARDFFRGEPGAIGRFADRILGSHEVYGHKSREAEQSVNFVTCHDGFSLNDLVSYNQKHNEANGEENRDGANDNKSWNCGAEGPTDDPVIEELRNRQVKNVLTTTMLSLGVPMFLMGDEVRRTQGGNNNAYCHDDESNWFDWSLVEKHEDVLRFVRLLIARRLLRNVEHEQQRLSLTQLIDNANKSWHGVKLNQPDWGENSHCIAFSAELPKENLAFHLILNGFWESLEFELPPTNTGEKWRRWIDTFLPSPEDITDWKSSAPIAGSTYRCGPRSVVMLFAAAPAGAKTSPPGD